MVEFQHDAAHTAVVGGRRSRATFVALEQQEQRSVVMVMKEGPRH